MMVGKTQSGAPPNDSADTHSMTSPEYDIYIEEFL
jgi:hypothetical protein